MYTATSITHKIRAHFEDTKVESRIYTISYNYEKKNKTYFKAAVINVVLAKELTQINRREPWLEKQNHK